MQNRVDRLCARLDDTQVIPDLSCWGSTWLPTCHVLPQHDRSGMILISSRALSFLDPLGPPVEQGGGADEIGACLQGDTALGLDVFEFVDAGEMSVGQHRVGQRPQVLRGLQLGGVGRQEQKMQEFLQVKGMERSTLRSLMQALGSRIVDHEEASAHHAERPCQTQDEEGQMGNAEIPEIRL
jgi:hypothetical protein